MNAVYKSLVLRIFVNFTSGPAAESPYVVTIVGTTCANDSAFVVSLFGLAVFLDDSDGVFCVCSFAVSQLVAPAVSSAAGVSTVFHELAVGMSVIAFVPLALSAVSPLVVLGAAAFGTLMRFVKICGISVRSDCPLFDPRTTRPAHATISSPNIFPSECIHVFFIPCIALATIQYTTHAVVKPKAKFPSVSCHPRTYASNPQTTARNQIAQKYVLCVSKALIAPLTCHFPYEKIL